MLNIYLRTPITAPPREINIQHKIIEPQGEKSYLKQSKNVLSYILAMGITIFLAEGGREGEQNLVRIRLKENKSGESLIVSCFWRGMPR